MQKSTRKGSQGISAVGVNDGIGVGGSVVFVGMTFGFTVTGVAVTSIFVQDTKNKNRRTVKICFITLRLLRREDAKGLLY
jgi:hypothetical protein